jgi:hypothetical protein
MAPVGNKLVVGRELNILHKWLGTFNLVILLIVFVVELIGLTLVLIE